VPAAAAPPGLLRTFACSTLLLLAGLVALYSATAGGQAFTTESLRRAEVEAAPRALPDFDLIDANGRRAGLHTRLASEGRVWIVDFIYTRCQTVCTGLGSVYQQLQRDILARGLQGRVGLLSISFDPQHDDAAALHAYTQRMGADAQAWQAVTLANAADRQALLGAFGIMVLPAPLGEFEHNAALHVVDAQGRLQAIVDVDAPAQALAAAERLAAAPSTALAAGPR